MAKEKGHHRSLFPCQVEAVRGIGSGVQSFAGVIAGAWARLIRRAWADAEGGQARRARCGAALRLGADARKGGEERGDKSREKEREGKGREREEVEWETRN